MSLVQEHVHKLRFEIPPIPSRQVERLVSRLHEGLLVGHPLYDLRAPYYYRLLLILLADIFVFPRYLLRLMEHFFTLKEPALSQLHVESEAR